MNTTIKLFSASAFIFMSSYAAAEIIAFENVNVIPMSQETVLLNQRVVVDNDKIAAIEPMSTIEHIKPNRRIDCQHKYLMPGFTDAHYHPRGATTTKDFEFFYKLLLANGVTTVVSMGEDFGQDAIAIKNNANKKDVLAPIYFAAGPMYHHDNLKTPKDALDIVDFHKKRGYDFIKVHDNFPKETYLALLSEAEKAGVPVVGHGQRDLPLEFTLRLTLIAHMEEVVMVFSDDKNFIVTEISDQKAQEIARQVKNSGVYISPTLTVVAKFHDYRNDGRLDALKQRPENQYLSKAEYKNYTTDGEEYRREIFSSPKGIATVDALIKNTQVLTQAFYNAGVPLLIGSDNIGLQITGFALHDEMEAMNKAGVPAFSVLNGATQLAARYLKRQAVAGTISEGKNAEFVLLSKNPLDDIKNTRDVQGVMIKGHWLDKKILDRFLKDVATARKQEK